jgi:sodium-independent sulfate anion transporter 11
MASNSKDVDIIFSQDEDFKSSIPASFVDDYNETEPTLKEWAIGLKPSGTDIVDYISSLFPFSRWITSYNFQWLAGDLVAGMSISLH